VTDLVTAGQIRRGGYILSEMEHPQAVIVATGSEIEIALAAQKTLAADGVRTRVVSMPSSNVFDRQPEAYQDRVLPLSLPTVAVEAAHPDFWRKYVGRTGVVIGIASFGESAPAKDLYAHFGITSTRVADAVRTLVHRAAHRREEALPEHIVVGSH
jgi:transketolase